MDDKEEARRKRFKTMDRPPEEEDNEHEHKKTYKKRPFPVGNPMQYGYFQPPYFAPPQKRFKNKSLVVKKDE